MADNIDELSANSSVVIGQAASGNSSSGVGSIEKKGKKVAAASSSKAKAKKSSAIGGKNVSVATHPPTHQMVDTSIRELKERNGSSLPAIKKYISANYKVDAQKIAPFIRKYLRSAVVSGKLVQTKGKGASGSFKLSVAAKNESAALEKKKNKVKPSKTSGGSTLKVKKTKSLNVSGSVKKTALKVKKNVGVGSGIKKVKMSNTKVSEKKKNEKTNAKSMKKSGVVKSKTVKSKTASAAVKPKAPKVKSAVKGKKNAVPAKKSLTTSKKPATTQK